MSESKRYLVAPVEEIPVGERKIVDLDGISVGVFNVKGSFYALRNRCPHQGGPLCKGRLIDFWDSPRPHEYRFSREGEILRCPWHGWEFDVTNGLSVVSPERYRARAYQVTVEDCPKNTANRPSAETYPVSVDSGWVVVHR